MSKRRSQVAATVVAGACGLACMSAPGIAHAGGGRLDLPTAIRVVHVGSSSFTISASGAHNARRFRLFASTTRSNLFVTNIKAAKRSHLSATPTVALKGLKYAATPYYYRLEVINGKRSRFSPAIESVGLMPAVPTGLTATATAQGTYLSWSSGPATGFQITEATDVAMTENVQTYTTSDTSATFSPPDLVDGTTYYFEVAALNGMTASASTAPVPVVPVTAVQDLRAMTYNILEDNNDDHAEGDGKIAPWSERVVAAARYVRQSDPDVIAIEEGAGWANGTKGPRQVDSLATQLGNYAVADTEIPPTQPHYHRTGVYVVYNTSTYTAVGTGNHWDLGNTRWAAYQILQNRATGARVLFVAAHLIVGRGASYDAKREAETHSLVAQANSYAQAHGDVPIAYGGDFNSDNAQSRSFNAPAVAMQAANVNDAFAVAVHKSNTQYNSANGYYRKAPADAERIDYIWASQGVAVTSWTQLLNLAKGKFVGVMPSDHNPVVADLQFPYTPST
jgi:endonuclease/exonuclease/phosphatase family metal-dependent hydrolase